MNLDRFETRPRDGAFTISLASAERKSRRSDSVNVKRGGGFAVREQKGREQTP